MKIIHTEQSRSKLESLQLQAESKFVHDRPKDLDESLFNSQSSFDYFSSFKNELPTKYEDPVEYPKLAYLLPIVANMMRKSGYPLPDQLSIGTVCFGSINAHIIPINENTEEYLLVINRRITKFIEFFSRFIASAVSTEIESINTGSSFRKRLPTNTELSQLNGILFYLINKILFRRKQDRSINYVVVGDIALEPPLVALNVVTKGYRELLTFSMYSFVLAHELCHLSIIKQRANEDCLKLDTVFDEELYCDSQGCLIATGVMVDMFGNAYPPGWQRWGTVGSVFFLSCVDLLQKASHVLETGTSPPLIMTNVDLEEIENNTIFSYPTPLFRSLYTRATLLNELNHNGEPTSGVFEYCDWVSDLLHDSWGKLENEFTLRHKYVKSAENKFYKYEA